MSRTSIEIPPAVPKPGTAGGSKNSSFTLLIRRHFSCSSDNDLACGSFALGPVFQVDDTGARIRAAAFGQNLVTGQRGDGRDLLDLFRDLLELLGFRVGVLQRGAWRRLEDGVDDALVLARDKTGSELAVDDHDRHGKACDDGQGQRAARGDSPHQPGITVGDPLDGAIKGLPHERQKNEPEADRPPQLIRDIGDPAQDQQPAQRHKQFGRQSARPFHVARVGVGAGRASRCRRGCGA